MIFDEWCIWDELMVAFIGNTLGGKVGWENFDKLTSSHQNSSDFSPLKVLRYTLYRNILFCIL